MTEQTGVEAPSSIGALWPPVYDANNKRVKGIYTNVIYEPEEILDVIKQATALRRSPEDDRVTLRFLADNRAINSEQPFDVHYEARVPLDGEWSGKTLVYFGKNGIRRQTKDIFVEAQDSIVDYVLKKVFLEDGLKLADTLESQGIRIVPAESIEIEQRINGVYRIYQDCFEDYPFDLTEENVQMLVTSPTNRVMLAVDIENGTIASVGVAEKCVIPVTDRGERKIFRMSELSDAGILKTYSGKGLYTAIGNALIDELYRAGFDLVYGEARACSSSVNIAARRMGRDFSGTLYKHCKMGGKKEIDQKSPYEDVNVWSATEGRMNLLLRTRMPLEQARGQGWE